MNHMYIRFEDVTLISDYSKIRIDDTIVYERIYRGERALSTDDSPQEGFSVRRYGMLYFDVNNQPCVIPDTPEQFKADMMLARNSD